MTSVQAEGYGLVIMLTIRSMTERKTYYEFKQLRPPNAEEPVTAVSFYRLDAPHFHRVISKASLFSVPSFALEHEEKQPPTKKRGIEKFLIPMPRTPTASSSSTHITQPPIRQHCFVACIPDDHTRNVSVFVLKQDSEWSCQKLKELQTNSDVPVHSTLYIPDANMLAVQTEKQCFLYKL